MRKKLILIEIVLAAAFILCINLSKGFYPFEKLTCEDLEKLVITYNNEEYVLNDDNFTPVVDKLNSLCAVQKFIRTSELQAEITLYSFDESTYNLQLYENHVVLNDSAFYCDKQYITELLEVLEKAI